MLIPLLSLFTAWAGFTVEGPSFQDRGGASNFAKTAKTAGHKGRIVRRYKEGAGWEFVVRFEDLDEAAARTLGGELAASMKVPLFLFDGDGKKVAVLDAAVAVPAEPDKDAPSGAETDWMDGLVEKHGPGRRVFAEAEQVKVVFLRTLPDGRVAKHVYARRGTDLYLSIAAEKGDVKPSETVALGEKAWLRIAGEHKEQDLQRSRETIARFGPAGLVPMVLDLQQMSNDHPELRELQERGTAKVDDETCDVFASTGSTLIAVGSDGLIRRVAIDGDKRVLEFRDYQAVEDVQVPHRVRILVDGQPESTVEIQEIELGGELPDGWFAPPA